MRNQNQRRKPTQPAQALVLFQGLGGTGKALVIYLLAYLLPLFPALQNWIRFLVQDIDPAEMQLLREQFYNMGDIPTHALLAELERYPERFPGLAHLGSLQRLGRTAGANRKLKHGGQVDRVWSKLAILFHLLRRLQPLLSFFSRVIFELAAAQDVIPSGSGFEPDQLQKLNGKEMPPLKIHQVSSSGGATGSGQLLDTAFLWHYLGQRQWGLTDFELNLDLVLPEVFDHLDPRLKANHWALMQEIELHYQHRALTPLDYGSLVLERTGPPWVTLTLFNRANAKGVIFDGRDEVIQMMAEVNRLKYFGPVGNQFQAQVVNQASFPEGYFCSAAGAYRLGIEVEALRQQGAILLALAVIEDHLLQRLPPAQADQVAYEWVTAFNNRLGTHSLLRRFNRDRHGRPLQPSLSQFRNESRFALPVLLSAYEHRFSKAVDEAISQVRDHELAAYRISLGQEVETWLNQLGPEQTLRCLEQQSEVLQTEQGRVAGQIERARSELEAWLTTRPVSRRGHTNFAAWWQHKLTLVLRLHQLVALQDLLQGLEAETNIRRTDLRGWLAVITHVRTHLLHRQERFGPERDNQRPVCARNVLTKAEEEALLKQQLAIHTPRACENLRFVWTGRGFRLVARGQTETQAGSRSLWTQAGTELLLAYSGEFFDFSDLSLEQWLLRQGKSMQEWLDEFEVYAAPLVTLDEARHPEPRRIMIIGSEHGPAGFFATAGRSGWSVVATDNPWAVEVLISWHHLNWRLLAQAEEWERAYQQLKPDQTLHVFAEWHQPPADPAQPNGRIITINKKEQSHVAKQQR